MRHDKYRICAVVPAAGRGSRLGGDRPKILSALGNSRSILSVLSHKLLAVANQINLIVSPDGAGPIAEAVEREGLKDQISLSVQPEPIGMGDAIFRGYPVWSHAHTILVVWGDQVFVSLATLRRTCAVHAEHDKTLALPLVAMRQPYVAYLFGANDRLIAVRQTREGEMCASGGFGDIGTFVLSVDGLRDRWCEYLRASCVGGATGEINFLPFLLYLSAHQWKVRRFTITDEREARGINTPEDLAFFQSIFRNQTTLEDAATR